MNRSDIQRLQAVRAFPAVTIYSPTHRSYPDNQQDPVRVRNLVREAKQRLEEESGDRSVARAISETLDGLVEEIDFEHSLDSVAIFAADGVAEVHYLPFQLDGEVVIDQTFATRNLLFALNRSPRYRVLVLSEKPTRLFEGSHADLEEVVGSGFPHANTGPDGTGPVKGTPHGRSGVRDERHREFFREVERRFSPIQTADPLPLVLVGIGRNLAFFREVSKHGGEIVATLEGSHDKTPFHELGRKVWPLVLESTLAQKAARIEELEQAVSAGRSASGLEQVWRASREGRGSVVLVEIGYREPAELMEDGVTLRPATGQGGPEALDDAVDEIIETVYGMGGEVVFVEPGTLEKHQKIALILRY
jgi:hypothetical protein